MPRLRNTSRSRTSRPTTSQRGSPADSRCSFQTRSASDEASSIVSASSQYWISARPAAYFSECRNGLCSLSRRSAFRVMRGSTSSPPTVTVTCQSRQMSLNRLPFTTLSRVVLFAGDRPDPLPGTTSVWRGWSSPEAGIDEKVSTGSDAAKQDHVVTVHDLPLVRSPQLAGQIPRRAAEQFGELAGVVVDQSPCHGHSVGVDQVHGVSSDERAGHPGDARGQQRRAPLGERTYRTGVEVDPSLGLGRVRQPEQPGRPPPTGRVEHRPDRLSLQSLGRVHRGGQHHQASGTGGDPRGLDLGLHAAGADTCCTGPPDPHAFEVGFGTDVTEQGGPDLAGIPVVEPLDVAEEQQQIGVHQVGDQRGEAVVVPEADLCGGDGVVLVDDRQHAHLEQPRKRAVGVAVVAATGDVVDREQDLTGGDAVPPQLLVVLADQQPLTDRGGRLLGREVMGATNQPERRQTSRDGTGRDQDHLGAPGADAGQGVDKHPYPTGVDTAGGRGERRRPDLHDDAACGGDLLAQGHCLSLSEGLSPGSPSAACSRCRRATSARVSPSARVAIAASMSRRRRAAGRDSSSRASSPRRPSSSAPVSTIGRKSKTTAWSLAPMSTASPSSAPSSRSRCSTPSRLSRSARKPTASSLLKSVCRTHRSGLAPSTRQARWPDSTEGSPVSLIAKSGPPPASGGRRTIRVVSTTGRSRRLRATSSAIANESSRRPSWLAAETGVTRGPRALRSSRTMSAKSRPSGTSILFSTTSRGRSSRPPYELSSRSITSRSEKGSRPGSRVAVSITWTSAAHRSTCRKKSWPSPLPSLAPSMRPGTSATVKVTSPAVTTPRFGTSVVNG